MLATAHLATIFKCHAHKHATVTEGFHYSGHSSRRSGSQIDENLFTEASRNPSMHMLDHIRKRTQDSDESLLQRQSDPWQVQ